MCTNDNKLTIVVEMGGSRKLEWKPLSNYILDEFESLIVWLQLRIKKINGLN